MPDATPEIPGECMCINGKWNCPTAPCQGLSEKGCIPFHLAAEAHKEYQAQGNTQTLERLNERGGFAADELASLLFRRIKRLEANTLAYAEMKAVVEAARRWRDYPGYDASVSHGLIEAVEALARRKGGGTC